MKVGLLFCNMPCGWPVGLETRCLGGLVDLRERRARSRAERSGEVGMKGLLLGLVHFKKVAEASPNTRKNISKTKLKSTLKSTSKTLQRPVSVMNHRQQVIRPACIFLYQTKTRQQRNDKAVMWIVIRNCWSTVAALCRGRLNRTSSLCNFASI